MTELQKTLLRAHRKAERELKGTDKPLNDLTRKVGEAVKEKRKARNLSHRKLQEASGVGYSYIIKLEKGRENPTILTLEKLASAMNCRLEVNLVRNKVED